MRGFWRGCSARTGFLQGDAHSDGLTLHTLPVGQAVSQGSGYSGWNEVGNIAPEGGHLLHSGGGEEAVVGRGDHVDALDPRVELAVELGHLELVLEVGDRPQALDDRLRAVVAGELDQQVG